MAVLMSLWEAVVSVAFPITFCEFYRSVKSSVRDSQFREIKLKLAVYFWLMSFLMIIRFIVYLYVKVHDEVVSHHALVLSDKSLISSYTSELIFVSVILTHVYTASTLGKNHNLN